MTGKGVIASDGSVVCNVIKEDYAIVVGIPARIIKNYNNVVVVKENYHDTKKCDNPSSRKIE